MLPREVQALGCPGENPAIPLAYWIERPFKCYFWTKSATLPKKCQCYGCKNVLVDFTCDGDFLLEIISNRILQVQMWFAVLFVCF